jgi:hypothetical protein
MMLYDYSCYLFMFYMLRPTLIFIYCDNEGMSFMAFVRRSLYPKGNNVSKDEGY